MKTCRSIVLHLGLIISVQVLFLASPLRLHSEDPNVKDSQVGANQRYKSGTGWFSIVAPAATSPLARTYKTRESQLKDDAVDYEEVVFSRPELGQAYRAGVRRIPPLTLAQMAKQDEKLTLSDLADRAVLQWRDDYAEPPRWVDDNSVETQFGAGLLRVYVAKRSSLLTKPPAAGQAGKPKPEHVDAYIAVLVAKQDDLFIYATTEDDSMQRPKLHAPLPSSGNGGDAFDPKSMEKVIQTFFASMTLKAEAGKPTP